MDVNEVNILCSKCYYVDRCPQDLSVKIIQCKNFKSTDLQRDLIKITKRKKEIKSKQLFK